jgi:hypothetical protein
MAMDHEHLVRRAIEGDKFAFVELTRRFQLFAFGSALGHVGNFQKAVDIVQEAFVAAWLALPTLAEPAAFPAAQGYRPASGVSGALAKPGPCGPTDGSRGAAERRATGRLHS